MSDGGDIEIGGFAKPGFEKVADVFRANFGAKNECPEVGANFALVHRGEPVVDLWGGHTDADRQKPWQENTIVNTYSTTKGIVSACIAVLADQDLLDYEEPVARYWPEFAANGKDGVSIGTLLSHQAGLSGLRQELTLEDLFDWDRIVDLLAAAEPLWEPGSAAGYHALTWGFLAGELIRRVTGQTPGQYLQSTLAEPLNAEFYIGVPDEVDDRVAEMIPPLGEPEQSQAELSEILRLTLLNPYIEPTVANRRDFRAAELPALNGAGNGRAIARIYAPFANRGEFDGTALLGAGTIDRAVRHRFTGIDMNLGVEIRWGAGFFGNNPLSWYGPNPEAFGHSGWGGSVGFADPKAGISFGYTPNQMDADLNGGARGLRLVEAVYSSLQNL